MNDPSVLSLSGVRRGFDVQGDARVEVLDVEAFELAAGEQVALRGESGAITIEPDCRYLVNPGSIGQPRDRDPRAAYMTYDSEKKVVRWHRVAYPVDRAQQRILKAGLPKLLADRLAIGS